MPHREHTISNAVIKTILFLGGIAAGFAISRSVFVPFHMPDNSMEPNLQKGDTLIILKHVSPKPGDIVLFNSPAEPGRVLVKRVVSASGDFVEIKDKVLYINNHKFDYRWKTKSSDKRNFPVIFSRRDSLPVTKVGMGEYFVLSDNLDQGFDSRTLGLIRKDSMIGKMIYKY
jgi:signal peptidase I